MTDLSDREAWEAANGEFLLASLEWIRLLLRQHSPVASGSATGSKLMTLDQDLESAVAAAADAVTTAEEVNPPPALVGLAARFGLSRFERDLLLLCAAVELDPTVGSLCAAAQGSDRMPFPTFALALAMLPEPAWEALSPQRGLRYWRLIEINQVGGQPLVTSPLRADERIVNHLKGLDYLDDRLQPFVSALPSTEHLPLPDSQQAVVDIAGRRWQRPDRTSITIQLVGADSSSKQLIASTTASFFGLVAYRLPADLLPIQAVELDNLARLWQREAVLLPMALYLDTDDIEESGSGSVSVGRFLSRLGAPAFLAARESWRDPGLATVLLDVAPPTIPERALAWRDALGPDAADELVERLAGQFALDVPAIAEIASSTAADEVWDACLARARPHLESLAERLTPISGWDDIVLPDDAMSTLHQIADQVNQRSTVHDEWGFAEGSPRGLGLSVLFAGPSGTGKTLAAEVLAHELQLDLYRTDLSAVVNKYIGETEKNLRLLFDAAERGGTILFIDEADALLGKRTEVKDAHDRYANVQIDYLLQRMESYTGLAIMATNMRSALDNAFLRRLRFIVEFPFPERAQRLAIWRRAFPRHAPGRKELDYARLATLPVTGGMVRNIALNAAFLAAAAGSKITMPLVLAAARDEFRKLELPIRERDFAWMEPEALPA